MNFAVSFCHVRGNLCFLLGFEEEDNHSRGIFRFFSFKNIIIFIFCFCYVVAYLLNWNMKKAKLFF